MDVYGHLFDVVQQETADKMDEVLRGRREDSLPENPDENPDPYGVNTRKGKPN